MRSANGEDTLWLLRASLLRARERRSPTLRGRLPSTLGFLYRLSVTRRLCLAPRQQRGELGRCQEKTVQGSRRSEQIRSTLRPGGVAARDRTTHTARQSGASRTRIHVL